MWPTPAMNRKPPSDSVAITATPPPNEWPPQGHGDLGLPWLGLCGAFKGGGLAAGPWEGSRGGFRGRTLGVVGFCPTAHALSCELWSSSFQFGPWDLAWVELTLGRCIWGVYEVIVWRWYREGAASNFLMDIYSKFWTLFSCLEMCLFFWLMDPHFSPELQRGILFGASKLVTAWKAEKRTICLHICMYIDRYIDMSHSHLPSTHIGECKLLDSVLFDWSPSPPTATDRCSRKENDRGSWPGPKERALPGDGGCSHVLVGCRTHRVFLASGGATWTVPWPR